MKRMFFALSLALYIVVWLPLLVAQPASTSANTVMVPHLIRFAGVAKDSTGHVLTGVAGITFSLYRDQEGGPALWIETQNASLDANGRYDVLLGAQHAEGVPMELFTSGEARWLGIHVQGQSTEQPRVLLVSVPYALKAADAETVGGLPPSAFVRAAAPTAAESTSPGASTDSAVAALPSVTGSGALNFLPIWTGTTPSTTIGNSALFQTGSGSTAKIGINTTTPNATLDVHGKTALRGPLFLPSTGTATASQGFSSNAQQMTASVFNKIAGVAVPQNFRWQVEPVGNDTTNASATLNLLYGAGGNPISETGLSIASNGHITFAKGQTFPGGTVTGNETVQGNVLAGGQLISSVAAGTPPLKVTSTTQVPNLNASLLGGMPASAFATLGSNNFVGNQSITGNLGIATNAPSERLDLGNQGNVVIKTDPGSDTAEGNVAYKLIGRGAGGVPDVWAIYTAPVGGGFGVPSNSLSIWQYPASGLPGCCLQRFAILPAETASDTGGTVVIDQSGNASQQRTASGWVKAMALVNQTGVLACFNSTLLGAAATQSPCGFGFHSFGTGDYEVDFGFEVDDRFISVSSTFAGVHNAVCTSLIGTCNNGNSLTPNQVEVYSACPRCSGDGFVDSRFYLFVY